MYLKNIADCEVIQIFSDIHGRSTWKKAIKSFNNGAVDEIIFLGDYIGSYNLSNYKILGNLREIIAFKKDYPQKVVLLWGNHDVLFLTGYSEDTYVQKMYDLFAQYKDLFQIAYQTRNYLFTHAGLTRVFWQEVLNRQESDTNYAEVINDAFLKMPGLFLDSLANPLTAGKESFVLPANSANWLSDLNQVVGHSPVSCIQWVKHEVLNSRMIYTNKGGFSWLRLTLP